MPRIFLALSLLLCLLTPAFAAMGSPTLDAVRERGYLKCGVTEGIPGFSVRDGSGNWTGFEVDYCRAIAAAVFNDPQKVRFTPLSATDRFAALSGGDIDILVRSTTWTMARDTTLGIKFTGVLFYDGQGFLVRKAHKIVTALDLNSQPVCIEQDTTSALNAEDYFGINNMVLKPLLFSSQDEVVKAYEDGRCKAFTADGAQLAAERSKFPDPAEHVILPETIAKEPLGPAVREGDDGWFNIARWTYFALIEAEELGITTANVDDQLASDSPPIKRFLGVEGDFGEPLGLAKEWAYQIVKHVGNYAEIYERSLGPSTPIALPRGLNALWRDGGLHYSPPIR